MDVISGTLEEALETLDSVAPGAPLLALGQTVFWDELMKVGVAQKSSRPFIFGVHDTDYFAKLPQTKSSDKAFTSFPHNDTTTKGLWSAAGEFSALFGSETVVSKETFAKYGAQLERLAKNNPKLADEVTEAWGWRGIVALGNDAPLTADVPTQEVLPSLMETFQWAINETLKCISEPERTIAEEQAKKLVSLVQEKAKKAKTLSDLYEALLVPLANFVSNQEASFSTTRTTSLLQFNVETSTLPRFDLVDLFINPETRNLAKEAYNEALKGSEIYSLDRFMSGAIPFDLVIPGKGRGTIRIANRAIIISTPTPLFISIPKPLQSVQDLAAAIEKKFGKHCTLIGKAVSLIGMLSREHVFVFHEGASSYVSLSRKFHQLLQEKGVGLRLNPILRVRYNAWEALRHCYSWLILPEHLQRPFGTEEICAPSISGRWGDVRKEQEELLAELSRRRRPIELIEYLGMQNGSSWQCLAKEYGDINKLLASKQGELEKIRSTRMNAYKDLRAAKQKRVQLEIAKGHHFRSFIFEKEPSEEALEQRKQFEKQIADSIHEIAHAKQRIRNLLKEQEDLFNSPEMVKAHERRRDIEREAELKRVRIIRTAVLATKGLQRASQRPSAWWFPILCSDGGWFRETVNSAECYLEQLV